jgi:hypothetical protein
LALASSPIILLDSCRRRKNYTVAAHFQLVGLKNFSTGNDRTRRTTLRPKVARTVAAGAIGIAVDGSGADEFVLLTPSGSSNWGKIRTRPERDEEKQEW